eukprot:CAMPEP_0196595788 /NCGR_PEP_ID=MMETSP1081-20130531/82537_1 /TAXON_ID=36882 /ORGANISM="Pyramimonas amylifera, Strain CCMP720" /LENGTH=46 /DNA_ID= /DNA_START= /DNA_END= /DNA_ORIENTATION=
MIPGIVKRGVGMSVYGEGSTLAWLSSQPVASKWPPDAAKWRGVRLA